MNTNLLHLAVAKFITPLLLVCALLLQSVHSDAQMRITEFMYSGANGEFVEFTNVGSTAINMTGWSFDDNNRHPGVHSLTSFGLVQPGESVIVTETTPSVFRAAWGLCAGVKITGGYTNDNLGRADEINLYDSSGAQIDRLTYDDQTLGGPRTQNKSAWVTAAGLGANTPTQWVLSAAGDAEGSFTSTGGDVGSPGKSTRAAVAFNPCIVIDGAPTIVMNVATTTNFLDGGVSTPPGSPYTISGVIGDPTDPASTYGIDFTIGDDLTPVGSLTVSASSNSQAVVADTNIIVTGAGASRNVKIIPTSIGYANISIAVNDGTNSTTYLLVYAASAAQTNNSRWHTGISDASDAIAIDSNYFVTADDELDVLNVYSRYSSGLPIISYNYASALNLPDPSKPEVDVEAGTRSINDPNRIFWLGSMSNGKAPFDNKPNRDRIFATDVTGVDAATSFSVVGYGSLRNAILAWGDANGYDFTTSAAAGVDSKSINGFAAEGLVFAPDSSTLYIGLRAPLVPMANRTKAVIAPILQFESWFNNGSPVGDPTFGSPIELNLGGKGIRDLVRLTNGGYLIIAGNYAESPVTAALYKWTGKPADTPILVNAPGIASLNIEGAIQAIDSHLQPSLTSLLLVSDGGGDILYNDGIEAKDLGDNKLKKFRSDIVSGLDLTVVPPPNTTVNITAPANNAVFNAGTPITVSAAATTTNGSIVRVVFYESASKIGEDSVAPYEFTGSDVEPGTYRVTARAYTSTGDSAVSDTVRITVAGCEGSGTISGDGYLDIPGTSLINLSSSSKYPGNPDVSAQLNQFEYGNIADNYGGNLRGYICAPATGNYIFYLSSADQSELWLSTDSSVSNIRRIAFVQTSVGFRAWFTNTTQRSAAIRLVKGARYFIQTVHKAGTGFDHLSVGWVLPGGVFEAPIPGSRLSPFHSTSADTTAPQEFTAAMKTATAAHQPAGSSLEGLTVTVSPNPSPAEFILLTASNSEATLSLKVLDITGRMVEVKTRLAANGTIHLGGTYPAGIYIAELTQDNKKIRFKLIKQ